MSIVLICALCGHPDTEHFYETIRLNERVVLPCGHDDYYDDGGERMHSICQCKGFSRQDNRKVDEK